MNLELGKAIKKFRIDKGITQEELANYVGISYQAVSKWENGNTMPDIALLPKLAVFFGVTIDNLFSVTDSDHFERIDYMLEHEHTISDENFIYTKRFLDSLLEENENDSEVLKRYAKLYMHRVNRETLTAARYLERAIYDTPFNNELINMLKRIRENNRMINFCEKLLSEYPSQVYVKETLIELYINERNFDKARQMIETLREKKHKAKYTIFESDIELALGNIDKASDLWVKTADKFGDSSIYYMIGERFEKICKYNEAIKYYERSFKEQEKPRNLSSTYSLAFLYDRLDKPKKAIEMWERILKIIKEDYNVKEGETIDWPLREIKKLRSKK